MSNKKNPIKVLVRRAGQEPTVEVIENTLAAKQKIVGGMIEMPYHPDFSEGLQIVCNEEGKFADDPKANVYWGDYDVIFGDILFVGISDEGDTISLTPEQIDEAKAFIDEYDASILQSAGIDGNALADAIVDVYTEFNNEQFNKETNKKSNAKGNGSEM